MEIVINAYTEEECAMAWYCDLENSLCFPSKRGYVRPSLPPRCVPTNESPSSDSPMTSYAALPSSCAHSTTGVNAPRPLPSTFRSGLTTVLDAISDWHYRCDQGYSF